jgi:carbon-monoxide dehydrogenase medium subunit
VRLGSLAASSRFLAERGPDARPFMGGTDILVRMRDGLVTLKYLVDVKHLDGMQSVSFDLLTGLAVGSATPMNRVIAMPPVAERYPLLAEAARSVASYQLRTRATVVGNLCNASPAGDTTGACLVYDGKLRIHGVQGIRDVPLATFFKGPGCTALEPGDVATALLLPVVPPGCVGKYIKLGRNAMGDLAIVGVTVLGYPDGSAKSGYRFRLALASVAPIPLVPAQAETILAEGTIDDATIAAAAQAAMDSCVPIDDVRGSARYRKLMVRNLTRQAVTAVWSRLSRGEY